MFVFYVLKTLFYSVWKVVILSQQNSILCKERTSNYEHLALKSHACHQKMASRNLPAEPAEPPEPPEVVSASAIQTPLLHAPGVRMTGVHKLPQTSIW